MARFIASTRVPLLPAVLQAQCIARHRYRRSSADNHLVVLSHSSHASLVDVISFAPYS